MSGFYNDPSDCEWLRNKSIIPDNAPAFASFVLYGNEDSPYKVETYVSADPLVTDIPLVYTGE